jgi:hypothetical protein
MTRVPARRVEEGTDLFVYDIEQKTLNVGALRDIVDK